MASANTLVIRVLRTGPLEHRVTRDHQTGILAQIDRCNYHVVTSLAITAWAPRSSRTIHAVQNP